MADLDQDFGKPLGVVDHDIVAASHLIGSP
jgi:hypothetical protein